MHGYDVKGLYYNSIELGFKLRINCGIIASWVLLQVLCCKIRQHR